MIIILYFLTLVYLILVLDRMAKNDAVSFLILRSNEKTKQNVVYDAMMKSTFLSEKPPSTYSSLILCDVKIGRICLWKSFNGTSTRGASTFSEKKRVNTIDHRD